MEKQLVLLDTEREWHLDDQTCEVGREGIAQARQALRDAQRRAAAQAERTAA